jgi:hypothetical protein
MKQDLPIKPSPFRRYCYTTAARGIATMLAACLAASGLGQARTHTERDVEAEDLLNFGRFLRYADAPPPRSSFDLCVLGQDELGKGIDSLASRGTIGNLPIHVRRETDAAATKSCAIVFISGSEGGRVREDLAILGGSDVLTVSELPEFLDRGGMIQFVHVEKQLRFAVNLDAVNRTHLILSSELLRVASSVIGKPTGTQP